MKFLRCVFAVALVGASLISLPASTGSYAATNAPAAGAVRIVPMDSPVLPFCTLIPAFCVHHR